MSVLILFFVILILLLNKEKNVAIFFICHLNTQITINNKKAFKIKGFFVFSILSSLTFPHEAICPVVI